MVLHESLLLFIVISYASFPLLQFITFILFVVRIIKLRTTSALLVMLKAVKILTSIFTVILQILFALFWKFLCFCSKPESYVYIWHGGISGLNFNRILLQRMFYNLRRCIVDLYFRMMDRGFIVRDQYILTLAAGWPIT